MTVLQFDQFDTEENRRTRGAEPFEQSGRWAGMTADARRLLSENSAQLARGLGWFSIGLGLTEVLAPRALEKFLGVRHCSWLIRLMGLREIAAGAGILSRRRQADWLWARVGGDVIDVAGLGMALGSPTANAANISSALVAVGAVTALDLCCAQEMGRRNGAGGGRTTVRKSIQIDRPAEEIYRFWRKLENLPRFMSGLESVREADGRRSHWVAIGPGGKRVEWDAEIVLEEENRRIEWRSLAGSEIDHRGAVRFEAAPAGRGSFVKVEMVYDPPGGVLGAGIARLFGRAPQQQIHENLHRLKALMETGEIITTQGQPSGRASSTSWRYDQTVRRAPQTKAQPQDESAAL
jgi:uncharacterized membrane protein